VRETFLPFSPPLIGEEEIAEVVDTLRSDWITTGPKVKRFEQEFAAFVGVPDAFAVSSCTAALHLSLLALGIGPGDGVVTTPLTFCSGVHVIEHVGARPVLADVEPDTLNLDPRKVHYAIETAKKDLGVRVKAIMPVHLYGHPCDLDAILEIAAEHKLAVIEDAAHSLPARYKGQAIGSMACSAKVPVLTCFSFYATKNLTTAEGGMLVAPRNLLEEARLWGLHGMNRDAWQRYGSEGSWHYEVGRPGYKYNLTDMQAALGLHQLRKLPGFHARRRRIVERYNAAFHSYAELREPTERNDVDHAWHLYVLRLDLEQSELTRSQFISELHDRNIGCSVHFIPIHLHVYYRDKYRYRPEDFPVANREYQRVVSLPLSPRMTDQDVDDVIEAVAGVVRRHTRKARLAQPLGVVTPEGHDRLRGLHLEQAASRIRRHDWRRAIDVVAAAIGLTLLSPLLALVALAIKLDDGAAVFYSQPRVGKDLRLFKLVKFRSMAPGAERSGLLTAPGDSRLTRVGRFLRKYKLDELPQLFNVMKGEMQLVGPRPEVERYVCLFRADYSVLLQDLPGITDPASISYRNEEKVFNAEQIEEQYVSQILPDKLRISLGYQQRRNLFSDVRVLLQTLFPSQTLRRDVGDIRQKESSGSRTAD
jgi:dTDP-4-amino-4,6-dideoxygalactose transaminase/lipopolysaccharide/colanic/teichoic acid biosynthesis glycosyltransferase